MTCNICGHDVRMPHKRIVDGKIVEMCVAKCHDGTHPIPSGAAMFLVAAIKSFRKHGAKR